MPADRKRRVTIADVYNEVSTLKVAVCGHPDIPEDDGLFGDVKYIRKQSDATNLRVDEAEIAIAGIVARCEERHGINATVKREINKKKIAGTGGGIVAIATLLYYIGTVFGWWS